MGRPRFDGSRLIQFLTTKKGCTAEQETGICTLSAPNGRTATVYPNHPDMAFNWAEWLIDEALGLDCSQEFADFLDGK
jgi:hypothetical protein